MAEWGFHTPTPLWDIYEQMKVWTGVGRRVGTVVSDRRWGGATVQSDADRAWPG